jgi:hypothetical protein
MSSVKLRHPQLKDVNFVVVSDREFEREQDVCPSCKIVHVNKAYHLRLDSDGEVTVSERVYERLAVIEGLPLKKVGRDRSPKPQVLAIGDPNGPETHNLPKRLEEAVARMRYDTALPTVVLNQERTDG